MYEKKHLEQEVSQEAQQETQQEALQEAAATQNIRSKREHKEITCIQCPLGCLMEVELEDGQVSSVKGYTCGRGRKYAHSEAIAPVRIITTLMRTSVSDKPVSVKTSAAVAKEKIFEVLKEIHAKELDHEPKIGEILIENVALTGVNVLATSEL